MPFRILTLNNISVRGLERLPRDRYEIASDIGHPDALLLRSADMHEMEIPLSVKAVARAGAGTNNIPVARLSKRGVPVFNAPGANANAVKELVIAGLFLAARNICQAWEYVRDLKGADEALEEAVEQGKKKFVGYELPGRTLGVVGLGAIGVEVANAAHLLGMRVLGFDPQITVQRAWQLSSGVEQALSLDDLGGAARRRLLRGPPGRPRQLRGQQARGQLALK
jgi:D-3-phosphoglycerate dehydrogenase